MLEEWKPLPLPEFEKCYDVSNHGRIRVLFPEGGWKLVKLSKRFTNVRKGVPFHMKAQVRNPRTKKQTAVLVKDMVAGAFLTSFPNQRVTGYKDGNPENNNVENLIIGFGEKGSRGNYRSVYKVITPEGVTTVQGLKEAGQVLGVNECYASALRHTARLYPNMIPRVEKLQDAPHI